MEIAKINPESLEKVDKQEVNAIHRRLHMLWAKNFEGNDKASAGGLVREDLANANLVVARDMKRRGMEHNVVDGLDRASKEIAELDLNNLIGNEDVFVVPNFVSVVGSAAKSEGEPEDIDLLVRADRLDADGGPGFLIRAEDVELPVRKLLDKEKSGKLHWVSNPQGPHDDYVPLADLVLRWKKPERKEVGEYGRRLQGLKLGQVKTIIGDLKNLIVNLEDFTGWAEYNDEVFGWTGRSALPEAAATSDGGVKIDLGCDENKPGEEWIGVDKRPGVGVDMVHDLENGLPFPDDHADEIRANHLLEHLSNPTEAMAEIWRVLKPDGVLSFEVPSSDGRGAAANPEHKSQWNRDTFNFYVRDDLRDSIGFGGKFDVVELEQEEHDGAVYVRGKLRAKKTVGELAELEAGSKFQPMKPAMAGYTETFSPEEIWDAWAAKRIGSGLAIEPKYNGFHAVLQKSGGTVRAWFEDAKRDRELPGVVEKLAKLPDFAAVANVGIDRDGKPKSRPELNVLNAARIDLPDNEHVLATLFDLVYWEADLHEKPWTERRAALGKFYGKYLRGDRHFAISPVRQVKDREGLASALKWASKVEGSEGAMLKDMKSPYALGVSQDWAKLKKVVEIKAIVLKVQVNKNRTRSYWGGVLLGDSKWTNKQKVGQTEYIDLGKTLATDIKAGVGDIITVQISELVPSDGKLGWVVPKVVDVDKSRKEPYFAKQVEDIAKRGGAWQVREAEPREETRAERAEQSWDKNWDKLVAKGQGKFILHGHFPSLTEDEAKLDLKALLAGKNQYHTDLRLEAPAPHGAWGFSCFEGDSSKVGPTGTRLTKMVADKPMRGTYKLENPKEWLTFAKAAPKVTESVGRVGKDRAKFFALDYGTYKLTFAREHSFEVLLDGEKGAAKGRYQINFVPVGKGERVWMITRPAAQDKTYPEEHTLESVQKELKRKGQKWLFWRESKDAPLKRIDVGKVSEVDMGLFDSEYMTDEELIEAAKATKAGASLKRALNRLESAIKRKDKDEALKQIEAALDSVGEEGYAYGYPQPKESEAFMAEVSADKIKLALGRLKKAINDDDFEKAADDVKKLLADMGYGEPEAKETEPLEAVQLAETVAGATVLSEGTPNDGQGPLTLRVKLIEPGFGNSKDNHYYDKEMLRRDAGMFVGAKMYESDHKNKSTRDWVSTVIGISGFTDTGAPLAEVVVHDPGFAQRVRNLKEKNLLDKLESSILANGKIRRGQVNGQKANIVEQIIQAVSVDWVTKAGAGGHAVDIVESEGGKPVLNTRRVMEVLLESGLPRTVQLRLAGGEYADEEGLSAAVQEWKGIISEVAPAKASVFGLGKRDAPEKDDKTLAERESAVINRYLGG